MSNFIFKRVEEAGTCDLCPDVVFQEIMLVDKGLVLHTCKECGKIFRHLEAFQNAMFMRNQVVDNEQAMIYENIMQVAKFEIQKIATEKKISVSFDSRQQTESGEENSNIFRT